MHSLIVLATTLALFAATPTTVLSHPQSQPGQTTTTNFELSITALSPTGQSTTVKFPGIPGVTQGGRIPQCDAATGVDAQKTSAKEVFCRTLRGELAKGDAGAWRDVKSGGEVKIVRFASRESTSTSTSATGDRASGGNNQGSRAGSTTRSSGGKTPGAASSAVRSNEFAVQSIVSMGILVAAAVVV